MSNPVDVTSGSATAPTGSAFVVDRDEHNIVHIRRRDTRECLGCIEAGLFDLIRSLHLLEIEGVQRALRPDVS